MSKAIDLLKLAEPFPERDVEWRIGRAGKNQRGIWAMCLAYITNRAIMHRLDEVCGPENWANQFQQGPGGGILCGISVRVGTDWVTKWDGAENTDMEAIKGGLSGAMKRAAVQWGIGRYLYDLPEGFAEITDNRDDFWGKTKEGESFYWKPPRLPNWALPGGKPDAPPPQTKADRVAQGDAEFESAWNQANPPPESLDPFKAVCDRIRAARTVEELDFIEADEATEARIPDADQRQRVHKFAGAMRSEMVRLAARPEAGAAPKKKGTAKQRDALLKSLDAAREMEDVRKCFDAIKALAWSKEDGERLMDRVSMRKQDFANAAEAR